MGHRIRALITRPEDDATPLATALQQRGVNVVVEPLLAIHPIPGVEITLDGVQALLITSANGARVLADLTSRRDLPVFAVGDATAAAARDAGFATVYSAGGDVRDLARLVRERLDPAGGPLFHGTGSAVAGDLAGQLTTAGFELRRAMIYEAKPAVALAENLRSALAAGAIDLILFFSPRTAATFVRLVRGDTTGDKPIGSTDNAALVAGCSVAQALCLSPAVADAVGALPWRRVASAERPDLPAMLALIDAALREVQPRDDGEKVNARDRGRAPGTDSTTPAPTRSGVGPLIGSAVIAALVAAGVVVAAPWWQPLLGQRAAEPTPATADPALAAGLEAATGRLDEMAARIATLEQRPSSTVDSGATEARLAEVEQAITELGQQIEAVVADAATPALQLPPQISALPDRLTELEGSVGALKQQLDAGGTPAAAEPAALPAAIASLPQRLGAIEQQVAELANAASNAAKVAAAASAAAPDRDAAIARLDDEAAALSAKVQTLQLQFDEAAARDDGTGAAALMLAVGQLRAVLITSAPFVAQLDTVRQIAASDAELAAAVAKPLEPLAARAETGVPTLAELRSSFAAVANAIAAADPGGATTPGDGEPHWFRRILALLEVSARPSGADVEGDSPPARAARAEAKLAAGDLAGAVAEFDGVAGNAASVAATWLADARARLAGDAAMATLQSIALARATPPPAVPPGEPDGALPAPPASSGG